MLSPQVISSLSQNTDFLAFSDYLSDIIDTIDTVDGLDKLSNSEAGEQAKVRLLSKNILLSLLEPFISVRKKKETDQKEVDEAKSKYGLT